MSSSDKKVSIADESQSDIRAEHLFVVNEALSGTNIPLGESPAKIHEVYNFYCCAKGKGQTIAIVCAFDYPTARQDLEVFSQQFNLPKANLEIVYPQGVPPVDPGWAMEAALDVQWAHAMAPKAKIMLVLAADNTFINLFKAVEYAATHGANVVSMSWGGAEFSGETAFDANFQHEGVTFVAGSGDLGGNTIYPSTSQYVLSAGGTKINRDSKGKFVSETGWVNGGGGPSLFVPMPVWQKDFRLEAISGLYRATPDVSFDADPASGVSIYDSIPFNGVVGWTVIGGTSVSAPCWAGIIACINGKRKKPLVNAPASLYWAAGDISYTNPFHCYRDITEGHAGTFYAGPGYDFITGLGSPDIKNLVKVLM